MKNPLAGEGVVTVVCGSDGNRVQESVNGVVTKYLVDDGINPTGYFQVILEDSTSNGETQYVYGLQLLSERYQGTISSSTFTNAFCGYDGHGSVRFLRDSTGAVTDTYDYDAFGNLLHQTGTTPNVYRFAGEQWDPDLNLYYNRARYMNTVEGRFITIDTFAGDPQSPPSLHNYLYAAASPVDALDPSGNDTLAELSIGEAVFGVLQGIAATGLLAETLGVFGTPGGEPLVSRLERERDPQKWVYAFGGTVVGGAPRDPRILGYNAVATQVYDLATSPNGTVGPESPPTAKGASAWSDPETAPLTGNVWKVQKLVIEATPGLGIVADGKDAMPPGPNAPGHYTIYPSVEQQASEFIRAFRDLPWQFIYNKKGTKIQFQQ